MYSKNRTLSLWFKFFCVLLSGLGLYSASGLHFGSLNTNLFFYYTHLSNILCFLYFLLSFVYCYVVIQKDGPVGSATFLPRFKGAVVLAITVTMFIYWAMLHTPGETEVSNLQNLLEHLIVPLLMILDWALFDPKGSFHKLDPFLWLVIPVTYYGFALYVAQTGKLFGESRYPYFFIDYDVLGLGGVALYVSILLLAFLAIGYLYYGLDHFLGREK